MTRKLGLALSLAAIGFALAGCGGAGGKHRLTTTSSTSAVPSATLSSAPRPVRIVKMPVAGKLRGRGAGFLSPTRLAFYSSGSSNCRPVPTSLSVESRDAIRIRLKDEWPSNQICLTDLLVEPVVIAINPTQINVHHRLAIRLDYPLSKQRVIFTAKPLNRGRDPASSGLRRRIAELARNTANSLGDRSVTTAEGYGPGSRTALVRASSGGWQSETRRERHGFYLIVLRGHFICKGCSVPPGAKPPKGTIATLVWSPREGVTDSGVSDQLWPGMGRLPRPNTINLTAEPGQLSVHTDLLVPPRSATVGVFEFNYPRQYHHRYFATCSFQVTGVHGACAHGVVVASFPLGSEPELGAPGAHFRGSGVAFELERAPRQPDVTAPQGLPRALEDYHPIGDAVVPPGAKPPVPQQYEAFFSFNGVNYWAIAWRGAGASRAEKAALASFIGSIHRRGGTLPACKRGLVTVVVDPRRLLPLTANAIASAKTASLRYLRGQNKPRVVRADRATADHERGGEAKVDCGTRVWRRTVVVYIHLRGFKNDPSLAEKVFFVGRFKSGYRVWQVVH